MYLIKLDLKTLSFIRPQYLVRFLFLCWVAGGPTIHLPTQELLPPTSIEPALFRNSDFQVAGLQVNVAAPGLTYVVKSLQKNTNITEFILGKIAGCALETLINFTGTF